MRPHEIRALALDFDRTLTDEALNLSPRVLDALRQARRAGGKVLIVSGRDLPFLEREVGDAADLYVGENGCLVLRPGEAPIATCEGHPGFREALADASFEVDHQRILASADVEHEAELRALLAAAKVEADLIRNKDRVMVLPPGVDKAAGLLSALRILDVEPRRCAAAGDGENDLVMLKAVGYGIAVRNAVPELKRVARHVTGKPGGEGVADWVLETWLPALEVPVF